MTAAELEAIRQVVREELRRCGLMPPRPTWTPASDAGKSWQWDKERDEWVLR